MTQPDFSLKTPCVSHAFYQQDKHLQHFHRQKDDTSVSLSGRFTPCGKSFEENIPTTPPKQVCPFTRVVCQQ
ncbi:hypothetical protein JTE90_029063 [Oedothorax gibbosus]|uniref:Uncharacterized protein n=1 Tax=Oedothorax gibbosus TaxID=931172 RepID=A0AAV6UUK5_9ARAC|nr:hypothetical protein JTE90_029063 [Oedothorax gibbosus]